MKVAITKNDALDYCREAPFSPQERYPEYPYTDVTDRNVCYTEVRNLLCRMGLDRDNYGKKSWNPLSGLIKPGDRVFIKPNMVTHQNKVGGTEAVITHGSVIRPILDYVSLALQGEGKITVGDAPYIDTEFGAVLEASGIGEIAEYHNAHSDLKVSVVDLRKETGQLKLGRIDRQVIDGDPLGYRVVDLKSESLHAGMSADCDRYRVAFYDRSRMLPHHTVDRHEYLIAGSILDADVVISVPKLKTHAKTGISCALKNIIGINGLKDWLPHHRAGPAEKGGDEYHYSDIRKDIFTKIKDDIPSSRSTAGILPRRAAQALLFASSKIVPFRDDCEAGSWYGNDTLPRTIADLNMILLYADKNGVMNEQPQRKVFTVVDGIVAGEKEGPMTNSPKRCGVLVAGDNPVAVDIMCSAVMGFDYRKISTLRYAMGCDRYRIFDGMPEGIFVNGRRTSIQQVHAEFGCRIEPPKGWKGHIELVTPEAQKVAPQAISA